MKSNFEVDVKTEEILKELDCIYGTEQCKEVIKNYASYIEMKKSGEVEFGNYNILIRNQSEYGASEQLVEVIWKILKANQIVKTPYRYLERDVIKKGGNYKAIQELDEELLIIDNKRLDIYNKNEIKGLVAQATDKIFIVIDKDEREGLLNATMGSYITWNMKIERISKKDKVDYTNQFLAKNKIKVDEKSSFIDCISNEPFWKVKDELLHIVLQCKMRGIEKITDKVIKENLKKEYYRKGTTKIKQNAMEELEDMIGIEAVKKQVEQIVNFVKVNQKRGKMPSLHMCFSGNPGTGKTTVARIVGKIFSEMKILSQKDIFIEAQRADLIGEYVGQTAPRTKEKIEEADGGVLFIDEAYSIASYIQDEAGRDYGAECIATLIKEMEDKRDSLCVILAGYTDEIEHMLKTNPGFESRIQFKIEFPDYTEMELYEIFKQMAKQEKYKIASNIKPRLLEYFSVQKRCENFSNARFVRNFFEKMKFEQADRIAKEEQEDINFIKKCDIEKVIRKTQVPKVEKMKIGFAS